MKFLVVKHLKFSEFLDAYRTSYKLIFVQVNLLRKVCLKINIFPAEISFVFGRFSLCKTNSYVTLVMHKELHFITLYSVIYKRSMQFAPACLLKG